MKPKLTLTRPKEPEFETSQCVRSVRVKSTAELEEEMMAKIPKFKARPVNRKILEVPHSHLHFRANEISLNENLWRIC
uniref:protein TPX2-like n=1 Tax=Fragaria vesca subsp. vesca TaxID=101020 RepID=UPI0005C8D2AF|nr:PREDICTED: protein TPX2-like [Fragaria vesca subsp. vesca]